MSSTSPADHSFHTPRSLVLVLEDQRRDKTSRQHRPISQDASSGFATTFGLKGIDMNRHAAALALVGWYLMAPPLYHDHTADLDAPIGSWMILSSYDNASDCEVGARNLSATHDYDSDPI